MIELEQHHRDWLAEEIALLTSDVELLTPSQWAERKRYLPSSVTAMPGHFSFDVCPYMREPLDCLSVDSPVREVTLMKGVQLCATTALAENAIGYFIEHVKTAPMMLATADDQLAKQRLESNIIPMLQHSGLDDVIKSSDEKNPRKTGRTAKRVDWGGGGFLLPYGAKSPSKLRSTSIRVLLNDEVDGWPDTIGKDGDPLVLVRGRTEAYESSRKIANISTPLLEGSSKIKERFLAGDQRYYYVCCLNCGHAQTLRWRRTDPTTGVVSGIVWELTEDGVLVPDSVRYICENPDCSHPHTNDDKTKLLSPEHGAQWIPTAVPQSPDHRSYHINALYSPVGMQTWAACVQKWLAAWDEQANRPRDKGKLQVFYNNVLGETYKPTGDRVREQDVSPHRRTFYRFGEIPNKTAAEKCGSPILVLTCAADVHKAELPTAVFGWTRGRRAFLIDYWRLTGNAELLDDEGTWGALRELLEQKQYVADDGKQYRVALTLLDSGYQTDQVYQFAADYAAGVFPIKGREYPPKSATAREFSEMTTPMGTRAYLITVDFYKDRWSAALKRNWDGVGDQPAGQFNAPSDVTDDQLKELTVEVKKEVVEQGTNRHIGYKWHRPSGAANELWDLLVYNNAALDLLAWDLCRGTLGLEQVDWTSFWDFLEEHQPFFTT